MWSRHVGGQEGRRLIVKHLELTLAILSTVLSEPSQNAFTQLLRKAEYYEIKRDLSFVSLPVIFKIQNALVTKQTQLLSWKVVTDINLVTVMPDEDKTFNGS